MWLSTENTCKGLWLVEFRLDSQVNFLLVKFCSWNYVLSFLKTQIIDVMETLIPVILTLPAGGT